MRRLYTFAVRIYAWLIFLASPFNAKAKDWWMGRKNKAWKDIPFENRPIWFHCASLGEFDMALPLMREWKKRQPDRAIICTFFSPSGMKHYQKRNHPVDHAFYLPIDTKIDARKFLSKVNPQVAIFVKYEFWGNHILEAKKLNIQLISLCSIFRKNQLFFKKFAGFQRKLLRQFDQFYVQNESSKSLLESIKISQVEVIGDLRFQTVIENKNTASSNPTLNDFCGSEKCFVIGSSWPVDEVFLAPFVDKICTTQKVIWAPHNVGESQIKSIQSKIQTSSERFTSYTSAANARVLILDTIGQLSAAYSFGNMAYVGGGQTGALHNILEPAAYGLPVIFGPKHEKFPEADLFLSKGFAKEASSLTEMQQAYSELGEGLAGISTEMIGFMESFQGKASHIYDAIKTLEN